MSNIKIMLCSIKEFSHEQRRVFFLTVIQNVVQEEVELETIPTSIKSLLDEFKDIVVVEFPKGLPPIRSISHHIDLIP